MTPFQIRKAWRVKLHAQRYLDHDMSQERYRHDAEVLNRCMRFYKVKGRVATWGQ